ncbi:hypothetical protein [Streptomyces sp. NPDC001843]|uniref:hypothetical protein n=1 Tax=Streptomyces sp. NPDC001843 TaxID=3364617 RepID=UPI0036A15F72
MLDHRLVQTAVIGNSDSDHPVILPMDAAELEAWRRRHPDHTYWCGYELGGCGGKLMDRLYHDKVCHFAHVAGGPTCGRAATGESSADHLFIKRGLRDLLSKHGQRGEVRTHDLGSGPGDAVDLHLPAARRRLRFQLSPLDYRDWRTANIALSGDADDVDWLFGTDGPLTEELLARNGYSLRFRLETVAGERRVYIGTQTHAAPSVHWDALEDCRFERTGLLTPSAEALRVPVQPPEPFAFPIDGPIVFALDKEALVPGDSPFTAEGRRLVMADVKPAGNPIVRAVLSLPNDTALPPAGYVYRAVDRVRLLVGEGGGWVVHLDRFIRLDAHEAARTGLGPAFSEPPGTKPVPVPRTRQPDHLSHPAGPVKAERPAASQRHPAAKTTTSIRDRAVVRVREILREGVPRGRTLLWSTLASQLGEPLVSMSERDRIAFLVEVDRPLWDSKPVLSALLREDVGLLPCLPAVLERLGIEGAEALSADSPALRTWADRERARGIAMYAKPPRAVGPRKGIPVAKSARTLTRKQRKEVDASIRRIQQHKARHDLTGAKPQASTAGERRRVSEATDRVERKMSVLGSALPESKKARRTVHRARVWLKLATTDSAVPPRPSKLEQQALRSSAAEILAELGGTARELEAVKAKYW